jgi:radical SAM superfamily enzyme YgiQ (UPF0313 family)
MKRILYIHLSNDFLVKYKETLKTGIIEDLEDEYYGNIYTKIDGYYNTNHYFEIPLWIAEANYALKDYFITDLLIIEDINDLNNYLKENEIDFVLGSILDATKDVIKDLINKVESKSITFLFGGYIGASYFDFNKQVKWFERIYHLGAFLDIEYKYGTDYSFFKGDKIIPRLRLSSGCLFHCKFCTIDKNIQEVEKIAIFQMALSFKDLYFKYVYVDDKSFGQASNYYLLEELYNYIREYNKEFIGFIIQTTASIVSKNYIDFNKLHISIVEIGIESFNNNILQRYKKPINEKMILDSISILKEQNIKFIPNIIVGLIGETIDTYKRTMLLLKENEKDILMINLFYFSVYSDTEIYEELNKQIDIKKTDADETIISKSFHTKEQKVLNKNFYKKLLKFGINITN